MPTKNDEKENLSLASLVLAPFLTAFFALISCAIILLFMAFPALLPIVIGAFVMNKIYQEMNAILEFRRQTQSPINELRARIRKTDTMEKKKADEDGGREHFNLRYG